MAAQPGYDIPNLASLSNLTHGSALGAASAPLKCCSTGNQKRELSKYWRALPRLNPGCQSRAPAWRTASPPPPRSECPVGWLDVRTGARPMCSAQHCAVQPTYRDPSPTLAWRGTALLSAEASPCPSGPFPAQGTSLDLSQSTSLSSLHPLGHCGGPISCLH